MKRLPVLLLSLLLLGLGGCSLLERIAVEPPPVDYAAAADGFRYARSCLTPQEQYIYDQILAGLKEQAKRIEGLYADVDMISAAVQAVERDYPELFWFSGNGQIETTLVGKTPISADYVPQYTMDRNERKEAQRKINVWTADCLAGIAPGASDYDKALYVYEYIIDHADYRVVEDNSIVNIMLGGAGLCGCYAKTAQYILNASGVPCSYVGGEAGGENHAWNLIWLDGNPCWMDPTWGDPVFEGGDPNDGPAYEYFAMTTKELRRTHTLDDPRSMPDCDSPEYGYHWHSGLYFDWCDGPGITAAMEKALQNGESKLSLRFSEEHYEDVLTVLFDMGEIYTLFQTASENTEVELDLEDSIWYSRNADMETVSIRIPY